ncbi:MAG: ATP-dependent DNA helicase RecG [Bacteroidales bacterium]|nr:ATP-dependent DNA helicase RecG [Bacteroidales bacterium]
MLDLSGKELTYIPGVGSARAEILKKELQIFNQEQMLYYFPYKYVDRSKFYKISELTSNLPYIQVVGRFQSFQLVGQGRAKRLSANFSDGTGVLELVWFKGLKFVVDKYKPGLDYVVFGKPSLYGHQLSIAHPDVDPVRDAQMLPAMGLQPFYNTTEKMKSHYLNSRSIQAIEGNLIRSIQEAIPETLPPDLIKRYRLMRLHDALVQMHLPTDAQTLKQARYRLTFEELFYLQLHILRYTLDRDKKYKGYPFEHIGDYFNTFFHRYLPFELTEAQKRVLREIRNDMAKPRQMNRLLQGDVGSGKTLVALMSMLMAADNGFQSCIMAPTEILANQHYETITSLLQDMDIRVSLLTGSTKAKDRVPIHRDLRSGDIQILIGTHALIEDTVQFQNLGFVVIDEQHRFGVEQRSKMWRKNEMPPHVLVMTATPIPRTLAMTLYGDLDVSVIDELPPGRKPIQTVHRFDNKRGPLYAFMREQLKAGRQIYVVYPLISESEKSDYKNLEDGFKHIKEVFPEVEVSMVHGKMKSAEKETHMQAFVKGEARILVATTVIEVGVNVPNASVMMIESAERFGLSQLHQLRGRVGRGADQSYCILVTSYKLSEDSRKRIDILTSSNDGFEIAEADLKLRGPGDLEGTQQSGIAFDLKIANLARDGQLIEYVRSIAKSILESDPELSIPEHVILKKQLRKLYEKKINWGVIS